MKNHLKNGFVKFLKKRNLPRRQIPFYVKWVSESYSHNSRDTDDMPDEILKRKFLTELGLRHEHWQVRQADYALKLYRL